MKDTCIFPGSFNPFTLGHKHLIDEALKIYSRVIVAVAEETYKEDVIEPVLRAELARKSLANYDTVEVKCFSGMLTDFLKQENCFNVVRGYRNDVDYEYEKDLERIYVSMDYRVNFVLIESKIAEISSETVRKLVKNRQSIENLVCKEITEEVKRLYEYI